MKTQIIDIQHFKETFKFARKLGGKSQKSLVNSFRMLNKIKHNCGYQLHLKPDWVKYSFAFWFTTKDGKFAYNGGLILHGFQETLSIEISSDNFHHWSIHT